METEMCLDALDKALISTGQKPEIFNTDQGSQFTSKDWTDRLIDLDIKISMDGKGRWMDNVFIERLWRSLKYEEIYLFEHATMIELCTGIEKWFERYNTWRPHETLANQTPAVIYAGGTYPIPVKKPRKIKKCAWPSLVANWEYLILHFATLRSRLNIPNSANPLLQAWRSLTPNQYYERTYHYNLI